jgi:AcrR family transcriptional regulator
LLSISANLGRVSAEPADAPRIDRRTLRRQQTIQEILDIAVAVMTEDGVNGLSLAEVARRLGVQPPSLYKYFPSLMAIYDALFERGMRAHLTVMRTAMERAEPGLASLVAGLDASGRWCLENPAVAQMLFWRPVPSFEPSPDAFAVSIEMVELERAALAEAVRRGELGPSANDDDAVFVIAIHIAGVVTMALANEPGLAWGEGRFSPHFRRLMATLPTLFPVEPATPEHR